MSTIKQIDLTLYGQTIDPIEIPIGETVQWNLSIRDPDNQEVPINLTGTAVVMSLCALDAGRPVQPPIIAREATVTDAANGECYVPWADGDTVPSGVPVTNGLYVADVWITDASGNRLRMLGTIQIRLLSAATLPATVVTPLPSQPPLGLPAAYGSATTIALTESGGATASYSRGDHVHADRITSVTAGTYTSADIIVDATGRLTYAASGGSETDYYQYVANNGTTLTQRSLLNASSRLSATDATSATLLDLAMSGATSGSYGTASSVPTIGIDSYGRSTSATNTAIAIAESQVTSLTADLATKLSQAYQYVSNSGTTLTQRSALNASARLSATDATSNTLLDLAASGATSGSYGTASSVPTVSVDTYGRTTAATNTAIAIAESQVTSLTADLATKLSQAYQYVANSGTTLTQRSLVNVSARLSATDATSNTLLDLATSGATSGSYTNVSATVDTYGRVTGITTGSAGLSQAYQYVANSGTTLTQRSLVNVSARLSATDATSNTLLDLATSGATSANYPFANVTVNQYGIITTATSGGNCASGQVLYGSGTNAHTSSSGMTFDGTTFGLSAGVTFTKETSHTVQVADSTTNATAGGDFIIGGSRGSAAASGVSAGAGGLMEMLARTGGAGAATQVGGVGGALTLLSGLGGAGAGSNGGAGGLLTLQGGTGGTDTTGTGGSGGTVNILGGTAGNFITSGNSGNGGPVYITGGSCTQAGAGVNGNVYIDGSGHSGKTPSGNLYLGVGIESGSFEGRTDTVFIGRTAGDSTISFNTNLLTSVKDPSNAQDAATKNYVDGRSVTITGGTRVTVSASTITLGSTVTHSIDQSFSPTWTGTHVFNTNSVSTSAQIIPVSVKNTTAAASTTQQYSPILELSGTGYKTNATSGSQTVAMGLQNRPGSAAAAPTGTLAFLQSINAGTYAVCGSIDSAGTLLATTHGFLSANSTSATITGSASGTGTKVVITGAGQDSSANSAILLTTAVTLATTSRMVEIANGGSVKLFIDLNGFVEYTGATAVFWNTNHDGFTTASGAAYQRIGGGIKTTLDSAAFHTNTPFSVENPLYFNNLTAVKTTTYTSTVSDLIIRLDSTSAAFTANLPATVPGAGWIAILKMVTSSSNSVSVSGNGHNIDGGTAKSLFNATGFDSMRVYSDGSNYFTW